MKSEAYVAKRHNECVCVGRVVTACGVWGEDTPKVLVHNAVQTSTKNVT